MGSCDANLVDLNSVEEAKPDIPMKFDFAIDMLIQEAAKIRSEDITELKASGPFTSDKSDISDNESAGKMLCYLLT